MRYGLYMQGMLGFCFLQKEEYESNDQKDKEIYFHRHAGEWKNISY